jgi:flagellar biosynthesis/type III secretory pathway M-ring protein FliF/YscJ
MLFSFLAQQTQYTLAYALIFAVVFLGFMVVCIPRPRKETFRSAEEEKNAKKKMELDKMRAKKKKSRDKKNKQRNKARKKALKK